MLGEDELGKIIEGVRGRYAYDCIVPLSGGRDSAYVLYMAKRRFNLRVLAVNFDNEFQTPRRGLTYRRRAVSWVSRS